MGLLAARAESVSFLQIGASVSGIVTKPYEDRVQTEIGTDKIKTDKNGRQLMMAVIELQTNERKDAEDDGKRLLYASSANMQIELRKAIQASGAADLEVGGTLTVTYTHDLPSSTAGFNPVKQFAVNYQRPNGMLSSAQIPEANGHSATTGTPPTTVAATVPNVPQQQPSPPQTIPVGYTVTPPQNAALPSDPTKDFAKIRELQGFGASPALIHAALPHLSINAIQAILEIPA